MKKSLILAGMLCIGYASAQEERVGINTDAPSATLNVKTKTDAKSAKNLELENQAGTKLMTVLNNGNVGINNASPEYILDIKAKNASFAQNNIIIRSARGDDATPNVGSSGLTLFRANGTVDMPSAVRVGDYLSGMNMYAYDGSGYRYSSYINPRVTGALDAGKVPTSIIFGVEGGIEKGMNTNTGDMVLYHTGNLGLGLGTKAHSGTGPNLFMPNEPLEKLHIRGAMKLESAYTTSTITDGAKTPVPNGGVGTIVHQNGHFFGWVSDANGWKQLDNEASTSTTATNGVQNTANMACDEANRGKMNFVKDVTLAGGGKADAFAVCLKGSDGKHYWRYLYGAGGETNGSGNFGAGL